MALKDNNFYLGNTNLPTPKTAFDYGAHPEWVVDIEKCRKNILYFAENFFYIINPDDGKIKIKLRAYQKRILRALRDNRFVVVAAGRQIGKSATLTIYALWCACFFEDQRILLVANKETTAVQIFRRVKVAYEMLPNWLKPGVTEYGKTSMTLANGSSIAISTTSGDTARGESVNLLLLDELAHVPAEIAEAFWQSVYPVISASKKSKILAISTPNGTDNLFYTLYDGANKKLNGWHPERIDYWEVPGRDEEWKAKTIREIGSIEMFEQEYNNTFHHSGEAGLDDSLFEKLQKMCKKPLHILEDGEYLIWKMPDPNHLYVVGVDVGEGVGQASTVMQVLDITDINNIEQVACYTSNKITPIKFIPKLNEFLQHWGKPPVLIERNNCGAQVVDQLRDTYRYENIVSYGINSFNRIGVQAHTNTKYRGIVNMRYWINETSQVQINDLLTVSELRTFQRQSNGTWCAKNGCQDDRVMSLIWALMMLDTEICEKYFEIVQKDKNNKPALLKILDYGATRTFQDLTNSIRSERDDDSDILPVFVRPSFGSNNSDIEELMSLGWKYE
jgi:hypothetical protein